MKIASWWWKEPRGNRQVWRNAGDCPDLKQLNSNKYALWMATKNALTPIACERIASKFAHLSRRKRALSTDKNCGTQFQALSHSLHVFGLSAHAILELKFKQNNYTLLKEQKVDFTVSQSVPFLNSNDNKRKILDQSWLSWFCIWSCLFFFLGVGSVGLHTRQHLKCLECSEFHSVFALTMPRQGRRSGQNIKL